MEINVTQLVNRKSEMIYYSASRAEIGDDAGQTTWHNARDMFSDDNLDRIPDLVSTPDELSEVRAYFGEFGAWSEEEIAACSIQDLNALLLQFIAGNIRERFSDSYDEENHGGFIYQSGADWFAYVGH